MQQYITAGCRHSHADPQASKASLMELPNCQSFDTYTNTHVQEEIERVKWWKEGGKQLF